MDRKHTLNISAETVSLILLLQTRNNHKMKGQRNIVGHAAACSVLLLARVRFKWPMEFASSVLHHFSCSVRNCWTLLSEYRNKLLDAKMSYNLGFRERQIAKKISIFVTLLRNLYTSYPVVLGLHCPIRIRTEMAWSGPNLKKCSPIFF